MPIGLVVATTRATCVDGRESMGVHRGEGDRCHYWAKGTGFGTGSTTQSWDVEQALVRQRVEEEHVVWLVRLLAKYINPGKVTQTVICLTAWMCVLSSRNEFLYTVLYTVYVL